MKVAQSCLTVCDYTVRGVLRLEYWSGLPFPSPGDLSKPGIEPRSPTLRVDSLQSEPQGKPKNSGMGSLALLQRVFQTQESNWGLLPCRQILCQLGCEGSPDMYVCVYFWLCWVFIITHRFSLVAGDGGYSLVAVRGLPAAMASLVAEHGL